MKRILPFILAATFGLILIMSPGGKNSIQAAGLGSSSIKGSIKFKGSPPAQKKLSVASDAICHSNHPKGTRSETYVIGKAGELKNVFVYIKEGLEGKNIPPNTDKVILNQKGCLYTPRVLGVQVDQPLEIQNSDATMHNVNARPKKNRRFNFAQPVKNMKTTKKFKNPELGIPFKCDVHPWMAAYVAVVSHSFFSVSDAAGTFEIKSLPPGTYLIEAWHEKLGTATQKVTVGDGESKSVSFSFENKG